MEDVVTLMQEAEKKLTEYDPVFIHKTEKVLGILRSKGVVSYRRLSENGKRHNLLAATLVLAHDKDTDFALPTRRQQTLYDRGISTRIVSFLRQRSKRRFDHQPHLITPQEAAIVR